MVHRSFARLAGLGLCLAALAIATPVAAQTGSSVDVIVGTVTDSLGKPVVGAAVEAYAIETQVTKRTTTNDKGRYTIFFNDGGGQYRVTITQIGMRPFLANVTRQNDDDRIMLDVKMGSSPVVLQELVARGNRNPAGGLDAPTPGSTERAFSAEQALRLPVDASDFAALAALVPGVIVTAGTDSTAAQFSIAGQSGTSNNYTVDGLSFSGDGLPQDAVRSTRVISNTFDVARGQFSGGLVSASTRRGSNFVQGSVSGNFQDYHLAFGGTDDVFSRGNTQERLGLGFGGPIVKDKFFAFASGQLDRSMSPVATLSAADAATAGRLGASVDSVNRFISLVDGTGLTSAAGVIDPNRDNNRFTGLLRLDANLSDRHSLSMRGDLRLNSQEPNRINTTSLPQVGGTTDGNGGGVSMTLVSRIGTGITNELRAGWTTDKSTSTAFLPGVPAGRVQNISELDGGVLSTNSFSFGGNNGLPQETKNDGFEVTEEASFFSPTASHRYRIGALLNTQSFEQDVTGNRFGTYTYNSLEDFATNDPATFTRTLSPTVRSGRSNNSALYLSDVWRPTSNLQLTLGGRLERSWFGGAPARNAAAEEAFGVRTDVLPTETAFTPRLGFSYSIASSEQRGQSQRGFAPPKLTLRGGLGLFRGTMPSSIPGTAQAQSGLVNTESQLICVGDAVPTIDWNAFGDGTGTIPTSCVGAATPAASGVPNVTTYAADYGAAKTWRASLGASKRLGQFWNLNVDASYVKGIDQSASRDLNLNTAPVFSLAGEDARPVYANPDMIITGTGAVPLAASRVNADYGRVNLVTSGLENRTMQVTTAVSAFMRRGASVSLSYSYQHSEDQGGSGGGGGGFGGARGGVGGGFSAGGSIATAGDPNAFVWATSSTPTHNIQANITWPFSQSLELTAIGRVTSGTRYTPMVAGDINGDGSRNDIAFIYDPSVASDPAVAAGMQSLLSSLTGSARECLNSQLGQVAKRNSCVGPWQPSLDLQVNWRPGMFDNRMSLSFSTQNLLGGIDRLVHGADDLHGWGQNSRPDGTLLQVTGFDAANRQFQYVVNERFGATGGSATAVRSPFQLAVQMRYSIGQDRLRDMRRNFFGGGQQQSLGQQILSRIDSISPHPAKAALAHKDEIALDARQVAALQAIADSSDAKLRPLVDSLRVLVEKGGTNPDMQSLMTGMRPVLELLREFQTTGVEQVKAILTPAQWGALPEEVRNPQTRGNPFFGGGQGGPGGAGGPGRGGDGGGFRRGGRDGGF